MVTLQLLCKHGSQQLVFSDHVAGLCDLGLHVAVFLVPTNHPAFYNPSCITLEGLLQVRHDLFEHGM